MASGTKLRHTGHYLGHEKKDKPVKSLHLALKSASKDRCVQQRPALNKDQKMVKVQG